MHLHRWFYTHWCGSQTFSVFTVAQVSERRGLTGLPSHPCPAPHLVQHSSGHVCCKDLLVNILGFADCMVPVADLQLCPCLTQVSTVNTPVSEHGRIPIIFICGYWNVNSYDFHMSWDTILLLIVFQSYKIWKLFLACRLHQTWQWVRLGPQTPDPQGRAMPALCFQFILVEWLTDILDSGKR